MLKNEVICVGTWLVYQQHGLEHRLDGPSSIQKGKCMIWEQYGEYHRENGPAMVRENGQKIYYIRGRYIFD